MSTPAADGPLVTSLDAYGPRFLEAELFHHLPNARVVFADYDLIAHDFAPHFEHKSHDAIDAFFVEHCGVLSEPQARHQQLAVNGARKRGYRPPYYGRAAIFRAGDRLIDVKGIGVQPGELPRSAAYATGLLTATEALHEILFERLCAAVFRHAGDPYELVPSYAVLDLGFRALPWRNRRGEPAFAIARRAHLRPRTQWDDNEPPCPAAVKLMRDVTLLLRRYGITSVSGDYRLRRRGKTMVLRARREEFLFAGEEAQRVIAFTRWRRGTLPIDAVNIQYTSGLYDTPPRPQVYDFGSFLAGPPEYTKPIYIATSAAEIDLVGEMIHPDDPRFPRADVCRLPRFANAFAARLAGEYTIGQRDGRAIGEAIDRFVRRWIPS